VTHAAPANYVWWLAGRSAGFVALALITCSVILGLAMAARAIPPRWRRDAVRLHQHLALLALGAIAAHGLLLAADPWLKAGLKGIAVPFAIGYRPLWTGLGIVAGYLATILALSFYVRRRIGVRLWRRMHRFTVVVYVLALGHSLGSGTDSSIPPVRDAMLASTLPVLFLFALRLQRSRDRTAASRPEGRAASRPHVDAPARDGVPGATPPRSPAPGRQPSGRSRPAPIGQLEAHPSQAN
jgi:methionine sulfoxide reductase heme-binding subunit